MPLSDWMVEEIKTGERFFYQVYRMINTDKVTRGGIWDNRADAERLAKILNEEARYAAAK